MTAAIRHGKTPVKKPKKNRTPRPPTAPPLVMRAALTDEQQLDRAEWITATTVQLHASALAAGMAVTGDWRVSACDAAILLAKPKGTLANWRARGEGPVYLKVGGAVSYSLRDLAIWLWTCRHDPALHDVT